MKSVVLLSAGLDSTVNLYVSKMQGSVELALTFNYGQRAAKKEIECAKKICSKLNVHHKVIDLDFFHEIGHSSLLDKNKKVPIGKEVKIDDVKASFHSAKSVWVPNRNGIFLNIGAGYAESIGASHVVPGFNAEEAQTFPDNSNQYIDALNQCFSFSTLNKVTAHCFTTDLNKTEIVRLGQTLNVDWSLIWPCYFDGQDSEGNWCGQCESCLRSLRAFHEAGVEL